ncbi:MAG: M15 family metallopeptidase [Clostridia bacterium]|nr:M15 family metallopeptidase [Clostridia bacterium]
MNLLNQLVSMAAAGLMLLSGPLDTAAPQNDAQGDLFLVNRQWMVTEGFEPDNLREAQVPGSVRRMREDAAEALEEMYAACKEETGMTLISVSGYRAYRSQYNIYHRKLVSVKRDEAKAQEYVAPPGASEHQTGLAMDVGQKNAAALNEKFRNTVGGKWVAENCWRFGFILRYGETWEDITGYKYEPWHFRYVGKQTAKEIHEADIPLETWLIRHRMDLIADLLKEEE